ncbi:MAG: hypothetical protein M5U28_33650 [Sandaracinaceae bacterium]|nr:hypothetical protein [Sandaracinaceae bacterium]
MRAAMIWVVVVSLVALCFAAYDSIRARYYPGIGAVVSLAYVTLARLASLLPPYPAMPLRDALAEIWWLYPVLFFALSFGPMVFAYLGAQGSPRGRAAARGAHAGRPRLPRQRAPRRRRAGDRRRGPPARRGRRLTAVRVGD